MHIQYTLQQIFSAHCSKSSVHLQCTYTAAVITSSVHTAANFQCTSSAHTLQQSLHLQYTLQQIFSVHCSKSSVHLQCTHTAAVITSSVHTAATLSGSNTIQYIQCTFEPPQGKPIPLLAYLQDSQQTLMVVCSAKFFCLFLLWLCINILRDFGECCESVPLDHSGSYISISINIYNYNTCLCCTS